MLALPDIEPMRPIAGRVRSRPGWFFEFKYDGCRLLCGKDTRGHVQMRAGDDDACGWFPEVAAAVARLPARGFILDGEACVLDAGGLPDAERLRRRLAAPDAREDRARFFAFDLLAFDGKDLRGLPLRRRKTRLRKLIPENSRALGYVDCIEEDGRRLLRIATTIGQEGVVCKRADSPYAGGRSRDWVASEG